MSEKQKKKQVRVKESASEKKVNKVDTILNDYFRQCEAKHYMNCEELAKHCLVRIRRVVKEVGAK